LAAPERIASTPPCCWMKREGDASGERPAKARDRTASDCVLGVVGRERDVDDGCAGILPVYFSMREEPPEECRWPLR